MTDQLEPRQREAVTGQREPRQREAVTGQREPAALWELSRSPESWDRAMSRTVPEIGADPTTAGTTATVALGALWRPACDGCGQRPEDLGPLEAVAVIRVLERRCASLLHHPDDSLAHRRGGRGSWSAMEPATQVSVALGTAARRLRTLLGEEGPQSVADLTEGAVVAHAPPSAMPSAALGALAHSVKELVTTIESATTQDWNRTRADNGATAPKMVWLALHEATHHLEDAELLLDRASAGGPPAWALVHGEE